MEKFVLCILGLFIPSQKCTHLKVTYNTFNMWQKLFYIMYQLKLNHMAQLFFYNPEKNCFEKHIFLLNFLSATFPDL